MKAACLALAIAVPLMGQSQSGPIAGSWTATFQGNTFIRLEIKTVNGAMTGGIRLGNIEVDPKGMVKRVDAAPLDLTPIFDVRRKEQS